MGFIYSFGIGLFCISVWAVIQLTVMAFFFSIEASTLFKDVEPPSYTSSIDYLVKVTENYEKLSSNLYFAAYVYVALIVVSWCIIFQGKILDKRATEKMCGGDTLLLSRAFS